MPHALFGIGESPREGIMWIAMRIVSDVLNADPRWVVVDTYKDLADIEIQYRHQHDAEYVVLEDPSTLWRELSKTIMVG
jgi:hypothetical protein